MSLSLPNSWTKELLTFANFSFQGPNFLIWELFGLAFLTEKKTVRQGTVFKYSQLLERMVKKILLILIFLIEK